MADHRFEIHVRWTGNTGSGTTGYRNYSRDHEVFIDGKRAPIFGSADPAFRGDAARYNPEELLIASLSACHMLWYLHLCADAGIVVTGYEDRAKGTLAMGADGSGSFTEVLLAPSVTLRDRNRASEAQNLHDLAHDKCFIARSVNFPVRCEASIA